MAITQFIYLLCYLFIYNTKVGLDSDMGRLPGGLPSFLFSAVSVFRLPFRLFLAEESS